jgi:hypothetical protein
MPDRANDPLPKAPDLSETAQAIARGRELVKEAQRLRRLGEMPPTNRACAASPRLVPTVAGPVPARW